MLVPLHELNRNKFSSKVKQFCEDYPIILEKEMASLEEMEKYMKKTHGG